MKTAHRPPIRRDGKRKLASVGLAFGCLLPSTVSDAQALRPRSPGTPQVDHAITSLESPPPPAVMEHDDDLRYLRDPSLRTGPFDALRYLPLDESGDTSLRFGVLARLRYEFYDDFAWGVPPGSSDFYGTRVNTYASLSFAERFRVFGAIKQGDFVNGDAPSNPAEVDSVDLHQAFFEVGFGDAFGMDSRLARTNASGSTRSWVGCGTVTSVSR